MKGYAHPNMNYYTKNKKNNQPHLEINLKFSKSSLGKKLAVFTCKEVATALKKLSKIKGKQALQDFQNSKEWELLQEYETSEQFQADLNFTNSEEGKRIYKKAVNAKATLIATVLAFNALIPSASVTPATIMKAYIEGGDDVAKVYRSLINSEKKPIEVHRKIRILPLTNITKNVGLSPKFKRERASPKEYDPNIEKYIKQIEEYSRFQHSGKHDPTHDKNIDLKLFDIDNNIPALLEAKEKDRHEKTKARFVKTKEGYIFYKNIVNGSKAYAINILKMTEVARAINAKELKAYEVCGEIFSNAFHITVKPTIEAVNHFYNECEAQLITEDQRRLFRLNPKAAVSAYIIKNYISKNQISRTGRLFKYIKNRFDGINLYFSVVDCDRTGEAHLHAYSIVEKLFKVTKKEYDDGETFFNSVVTQELEDKANANIFHDKERGIQLAKINVQPTVDQKHFEYLARKAALSEEEAIDNLNYFYKNDVDSGEPQMRHMENEYIKAVWALTACQAYGLNRVRRSRNIVEKLGAEKERVLAYIEDKYQKKPARNIFHNPSEKLKNYFNDPNNPKVYYLNIKEAKQFKNQRPPPT